MKEFVAELQAKGIFAREVPCSNIAYHSKYIASAGKNNNQNVWFIFKYFFNNTY